MTKQGSRRYQKANYRDLVRPAVNVYNHRVSKTAAYQREFYSSGRKWKQQGASPGDISCLAKAARAASRAFTYAKVTGRRMYVVPIFQLF